MSLGNQTDDSKAKAPFHALVSEIQECFPEGYAQHAHHGQELFSGNPSGAAWRDQRGRVSSKFSSE